MRGRFENIEIKGIQSVVPKEILNLRDLKNEFSEEEIEKIIKVTGISSVRIAPENITTADLCLESANKLIEKLKIKREDIDGLIFVSQTPDYILPQTSFILQDKLGLKKDTYCLDIRLGCSGYIHGLFQACLLLDSKCCKNILVLAGDTTSRLINPKDRALRMVFGDAGTCTYIKRNNKAFNELCFIIYGDGSGSDKLIIPAGGFRKPHSIETSVVKEAEDKNFRSENNLFMDGMGIFNFAISKVPELTKELVELYKEYYGEEVDYYLFHQANKFMLESLRRKLKLSPEQLPINTDYGNTGPASIPLLISSMNLDSSEVKGVIMEGFGVGLSWAGCYTGLYNTKLFLDEL